MFELIKKIFIGLLTDQVNWSNHKKWVSLSNQKCMVQPTLINLHPNKYNQEFHYYPFAAKSDRCAGSWSCNTLNDLSDKVCVPKNRMFKYICFYYNYWKKWIWNFNKRHIMRI